MKKIISLLFILFITVTSYSQDLKKYQFDYYSVYELKVDSTSIYKYRYIIGNSNDKSYALYLNANSKEEIIEMALYDFTNMRQYDFEINNKLLKDIKSFNDISKSYTIYKYDVSKRHFKKSIQDVTYETIDDTTKITLTVYKNSNKKTIKYKSYFFTKEVPFVQNQFYVTNIVFAYSVSLDDIKTTGVLTKQYTVTKDFETIGISELIEIKPLDFSLELKTEPVITRTITTIHIK